MKKIALGALLAAALCAFFPSRARAEDADMDVKYSYGTVKTVSGSEITIIEYDYEKDEDSEVAYDMKGAKLENVRSAADIGADDTVDLMYREENGRRVVINASVEKATDDIGMNSLEEPVEPGTP